MGHGSTINELVSIAVHTCAVHIASCCHCINMEDPKAAMKAGIIVQDGISKNGNQKFLCKLCQVPFTDIIENHIRNDSHKRAFTWEAISNVSASQYLLNSLPDIVLRAKQRGEIQAFDKSRFSYNCKVCTGKEPFCGLQQLQDHLNGKNHKPKNLAQTNLSTQRSTINGSSSSQKVSETNSSYSNLPPDVQILLGNKTIQIKEYNGTKSLFICHVCNDKAMTGIEPLMAHIQSTKHMNKFLVPDSSGSSLPLEVQNLIRKRIIQIKESNGMKSSFMCLVCNNLSVITGVVPLISHVESSKHKNKETPPPHMVLDSRDLTPPSEIMKRYTSEPLQVLPTENPKNKRSHSKNMNKKVVVLNYIEFLPNLTPNLSKRQGAETDSSNLFEKFTNFGYDVAIHNNLTASATEDVLNRLQANTSMECLILIILSHGQSKYSFYTRDGGVMDLDRIRNKFTDTACPQLRGNPKIILSNFCRGQDLELQVDASALIEVPHNMITVHACVDNVQALRHPRDGTVFISSFCKVVEQNQDLQETLNKLYEKMREARGTTPMAETFFPFPKFTF